MTDVNIRQIVQDLLAPLSTKLDNLREDVSDLQRRPQIDNENRRGDIIIICAVIGSIVGISSICGTLASMALAIILHFVK